MFFKNVGFWSNELALRACRSSEKPSKSPLGYVVVFCESRGYATLSMLVTWIDLVCNILAICAYKAYLFFEGQGEHQNALVASLQKHQAACRWQAYIVCITVLSLGLIGLYDPKMMVEESKEPSEEASEEESKESSEEASEEESKESSEEASEEESKEPSEEESEEESEEDDSVFRDVNSPTLIRS